MTDASFRQDSRFAVHARQPVSIIGGIDKLDRHQPDRALNHGSKGFVCSVVLALAVTNVHRLGLRPVGGVETRLLQVRQQPIYGHSVAFNAVAVNGRQRDQ